MSMRAGRKSARKPGRPTSEWPGRRESARGLGPRESALGSGRLESVRGLERRKSARGPGRPTSTSGLYAREKLLEAATELFAKQGVAATTFAMIAEAGGADSGDAALLLQGPGPTAGCGGGGAAGSADRGGVGPGGGGRGSGGTDARNCGADAGRHRDECRGCRRRGCARC